MFSVQQNNGHTMVITKEYDRNTDLSASVSCRLLLKSATTVVGGKGGGSEVPAADDATLNMRPAYLQFDATLKYFPYFGWDPILSLCCQMQRTENRKKLKLPGIKKLSNQKRLKSSPIRKSLHARQAEKLTNQVHQ